MSDCESFAELDECGELHDEIFKDELVITCDVGGEVTVIGTVTDTSLSKVLSKRRKKTTKTFCINNTTVALASAIVRYLNGDTLDDWNRIETLKELYVLAKQMQIPTLITMIANRVVDMTGDDLFAFLGVKPSREMETECVWIYGCIG